eukprot:XP_001610276.1 hypothetical protein [Babesia bovis T2Bo]
MKRLRMQQLTKHDVESAIYKNNSIVPYLNTLMLPLFLAAVIPRKGSVIPEVLLFGSLLCCLLDIFMFDTVAILFAAVLSFFLSDYLFEYVLGRRIIFLTIIQALVHEYLRDDLTKSLDIADSVVIAQLVTIGLHLAAGGYVRNFSPSMMPLVDFCVYLGYLLMILLAVVVTEGISNSFPRSCIKRKMSITTRIMVLIPCIYSFVSWGTNEKGYKMGLVPFKYLIRQFTSKNAAITLGIWTANTLLCVAIVYGKAQTLNGNAHKHNNQKSTMVIIMRKMFHMLLMINAAVAIYTRQQLLLAITLYILFVAMMVVELVRFHGYMPTKMQKGLTQIYNTFGENNTVRNMVLPHAWLILAAGVPLWMEILQKRSLKFIEAFLGLAVVTLADTAAALAGNKANKMKCNQKSIRGSFAFFVTTLLALGASMYAKYGNKLKCAHAAAAAAVAMATTIVEAGCPGIDNFNVAMMASALYANIDKIL